MNFCSANSHINGQTHWNSCSLQSVSFSCTKLEAKRSEATYSKISGHRHLPFDKFFRKHNCHGVSFVLRKQIPFRVSSKEKKIQYAFTARTNVKVPRTWPLRKIRTIYLGVKNLNLSILIVSLSANFPILSHFSSSCS